MVAGNPCYSGDSGLPLLPSSTNPAGNQFIRARQGDTPPPAVVNPGANIRLTVGNCYEADVPIVGNGEEGVSAANDKPSSCCSCPIWPVCCFCEYCDVSFFMLLFIQFLLLP